MNGKKASDINIDSLDPFAKIHELRQESELTTFTTEGIIKTQNGQSIEVSMSLIMSRSTVTEVNLSYKAGDAVKYPLVVNLVEGQLNLLNKSMTLILIPTGLLKKFLW